MKILNELSDLCEMVKKQAEVGKKYDPTSNKIYETQYTLYSCDIMIGNNCVYLKSDSKTASYLGYNTFNFIQTRNDYFNRQTEDWINNILAKSDLVSVVSERLRNQFFQNATSHIDRLKAQIH
jgi:CO dehydrogenase/acetyl-CoA synthase alpha subunit